MSPTSVVDKSDFRVRTMFGEIAPQYDRLNHLLSLNVDRYWRWRTVKILKPNLQQPILDCCTGTGDMAFALEASTGGQVPVIGADFCPEMLRLGAAKRKRRVNSRVRFIEADTQRLPFRDGVFQIVSVAFGLRNVSDMAAGLREMLRVCAPGGQVAVLEFSTPRHQPIRGMYQWYFRNVVPRVGQRLVKNRSAAYEYLPLSVNDFPDYERLINRMRSVGLRQTRFIPLTFGIATLYLGVK